MPRNTYFPGSGRSTRTPKRASLLLLALTAGLVGCQEGMVDIDDGNPATACQSTTPISVGQSMTGTLSEGDCAQDGVWTDRWSLDLTSETSVRIDLSSSSFDAFLELHHAGGGMIATNDDAGSLNSRINETLGAGSYVIVARSLGTGQSGSYQLSVAIGPDCRSMGTVSIGESVTGRIEADDCLFEWGGLMHNWSFDLDRPTGVRIEVESNDFDEALVLTDQYDNIQWVFDGFGPLGHARGDLMLEAGSWTISAISIYENPGAYELRVDLMPPCNPGKPLIIGETFAGTIDGEDCLLHDWAPADSLVLDLDRDVLLDFVVKSTDITTFLHVRDRFGNEVAFGYPEYNPNTGQPTGTTRMSTGLDAGFYSVYVASEGYPASWGDYEITVNEVVCDETSTIVLDTLVSGTLESGDCLSGSGAYQDRYELVVPADTTVRIDMESSAFDTYLTLRDSTDAIVRTDDDGGAGLNSRIEVTLTAGSYVIEAAALGQGFTGDYTLGVTSSTPSPAPQPSSAVSTAVTKTIPSLYDETHTSIRDRDVTRETIARLWGRAGKVPHHR